MSGTTASVGPGTRGASKYDAALYCNAANAVFTWLPRVFGTPVALNVDGLERNRKKWNALAKTWYRISEWLATWMPNKVITDAHAIADYYRARHKTDSVMIPYGAEIGKVESGGVLSTLGLERGKYFLYVSRMEPENNALLVREAFEQVNTDFKLADEDLNPTSEMQTTAVQKEVAINNRYEIKSLEQVVAMAKSNERIMVSRFLPNAGLSAGYLTSSSHGLPNWRRGRRTP